MLDWLVSTHPFFLLKYYLPFYDTSHINEEGNGTKPSLQLVFPGVTYLSQVDAGVEGGLSLLVQRVLEGSGLKLLLRPAGVNPIKLFTAVIYGFL